MELLRYIIVGIAGSFCFAVLFKTPKKYLFATISLGLAAFLGNTYAVQRLDMGLATFVVALVIGTLSHGLARMTGSPAQGFLIPGMILLVPGVPIYRGFEFIMNRDVPSAMDMFTSTMAVTFSLSFALLLANWVVPPKRSL